MQTGKQAVCKTVAFGRCRFKSCSADLYAAVPQLVEELLGRQPAGNTGLQVQVLSAALSYLETYANWQAACPEHR